MTNGNDVTQTTIHTNLFNKKKITPYSVPPAHAPSVLVEGGNEIEGGKKPFMRADKKGFRKYLTK